MLNESFTRTFVELSVELSELSLNESSMSTSVSSLKESSMSTSRSYSVLPAMIVPPVVATMLPSPTFVAVFSTSLLTPTMLSSAQIAVFVDWSLTTSRSSMYE